MGQSSPFSPKTRHVAWLGLLAGALLFVIGVRFLITPDSAVVTFGLPRQFGSGNLRYVVGLRDLWLAALAVALVLLGEWRALALWFGLGSLVCFGDALIVASARGAPLAIAFHIGSGIYCLALTAASWRVAGGRTDAS